MAERVILARADIALNVTAGLATGRIDLCFSIKEAPPAPSIRLQMEGAGGCKASAEGNRPR